MSYLYVKWNTFGCGSLADVSDIRACLGQQRFLLPAWLVQTASSRMQGARRRRYFRSCPLSVPAKTSRLHGGRSLPRLFRSTLATFCEL